jgi:dihydrodipicolinate synthase/N-acetylneuraminate lyase
MRRSSDHGYNWERGVAVEISWETAIELAKIARVVAIKDSTMNRVQALTTLERVGDRRTHLWRLHRSSGHLSAA